MDMTTIEHRLDTLVDARAIDGALAAHAKRLMGRMASDQESVATHFCQAIAAARITSSERIVLSKVPDLLDLARRAINKLPLGNTEATHLAHCFQGEFEGACKYGDADCPAAVRMRDPGFGEVICHCSEDDGVPDVGIALGLGAGCQLWIGELLKRDGGDVGVVFYGPGNQRIAAPMWPTCEWQDIADIVRHHVAPALLKGAAAAAAPRTATELGAIIRAWLDADDVTHFGPFERRLDAIISPDGEGDAGRAATALVEWCRRAGAAAGHGHIDENQRFVIRALVEEFDRANAIEALGDITGAAALGGETMQFVYRNYRGEVSVRQVRTPVVTFMGSTEWHPERQWLVRAFDIEKNADRDFALRDMRFFHQMFEGEAA